MTQNIAGLDCRPGLQAWQIKNRLENRPEPISLPPTESPLNEGAALP